MSGEVSVPKEAPEVIVRTPDNGHLDQTQGVGEHQPQWVDVDCPSCGTVPCSHPDVLACRDCCDDWPCHAVQSVAAELDRLVDETDWAWAVGTSLRARAAELRGGGAGV